MDDVLSVGADICARIYKMPPENNPLLPPRQCQLCVMTICNTETSELTGDYGPGGVMPDGFVACALLCDPESAIPVVFCAAFCFSIVQSNV